MRMTKDVYGSTLMLALLLACGAISSRAQTSPSGQAVTPGTSSKKVVPGPCNNPDTAATAAPSTDPCPDAVAGFGGPILTTPDADRTRNVVAFVRVEATIPRPPVALPDGDSFSAVGDATLIKVRRSELKDCLATGKRISARASASTSTTCLDRKGELLAYEECKTGSADCIVVMPQDIAKQQGSAKQ